ncbi:MAG: ATP-binding protein [Clostridia bacterium]|nr:ATP-binding protein [Clostridia bacterium]
MSANVHNLIAREYEKKQKAAFDKLEAKRSEIYTKIPRIEEIDSLIQKAGINYNKLILTGQNSAQDVVAVLESKIVQLKNEKKKLLIQNGYAENYLEMAYECSLCKDTGTTALREKCVCYKQLMINHLHDQANLKLARTENFSVFNENYYSDTANMEKYGIAESPRENILTIKDRCIKFIENFTVSEEKNLFFSGPTGVGKTFMANCIAMELLNQGRTVLYETAPRLFDIITEYKMKSFRDDEYDDSSYKNIFDVDLLVVDDLGTESQSGSRFAELLNILNTRQINNLSRPCKTIISTNAGTNELYKLYQERVVSRIIGSFVLLKFVGEDIRMTKRMNLK